MTQPTIEMMLAAILTKLDGPRFRPVPIAEFAARVTSFYRDRSPATRVKMAQVLREIASLPGVTTTGDLTSSLVSAWRVAQKEAGRSPNTIRGLESYLRAACNFAVEEVWLDRCPFSRKRPLERRKPTRTVHHTVAEIARVLDHLAGKASGSWPDHRLYALFSVYAFTGLRKMEALHLDWEDVRLKERFLLVNPARRRTKTEAAAAPVPLPPALVKILKGWKPECGSAWVFPTVDRTRPWTGGIAGTKPLDRIKAAGQACGVEGLTILSLRHSWATAAEHLWGLTAPQIQRVLRHTSVRTQDAYRHPDEPALARIGNVIRFPSSAPRRRRLA